MMVVNERLTLRRGVQLVSERGEHGSGKGATALPNVDELLDFLLQSKV